MIDVMEDFRADDDDAVCMGIADLAEHLQKVNVHGPSPERSSAAVRYVIFPIEDAMAWDHYKVAQQQHWTADQFDVQAFAFALVKAFHIDTSPLAPLVTLSADWLAQISDSPPVVLPCSQAETAESRALWGVYIARNNLHIEVFSRLLVGFDQALNIDAVSQSNPSAGHDLLLRKADLRSRCTEVHPSSSDAAVTVIIVDFIFSRTICHIFLALGYMFGCEAAEAFARINTDVLGELAYVVKAFEFSDSNIGCLREALSLEQESVIEFVPQAVHDDVLARVNKDLSVLRSWVGDRLLV